MIHNLMFPHVQNRFLAVPHIRNGALVFSGPPRRTREQEHTLSSHSLTRHVHTHSLTHAHTHTITHISIVITTSPPLTHSRIRSHTHIYSASALLYSHAHSQPTTQQLAYIIVSIMIIVFTHSLTQ
eukprot:6903415-Pyramimonas_sp.AAC.1